MALCDPCRSKDNERTRARRLKWKIDGGCVACGKERNGKDRKYCLPCGLRFRWYHYRKTGGIHTWNYYYEWYVIQKRECAACKRTLSGKNDFNIDHDHRTGQIRGLLCHGCNRAIGWSGDNPSTLMALAEYLKRQ